MWKYNKPGDYSVKYGYWYANQLKHSELIREASALPSINGIKESIWAMKTSSKIKIFVWRALSEAIPVANKIISRGMKSDSRCQACGLEGESINHVLFTCTMARQILALANYPSPQQGFDPSSLFTNVNYLLKTEKDITYPLEVRRLYPWIL